MSAEKNHEKYLEQIEIAVAETTKELMSKHNGDLRAMAKVCAEKQVEINRLKEFQDNDRKSVRSLRQKLKEASYELNEELDDINTRWAEDKEADRIQIDGQKEQIEKLKDEIECRCSTWDTKEKEYEAEIAELKPRAYEFRRMADNYDYLSLCNDLRKEEIEKLKGEADVRFAVWQEETGQIEQLKAENEKLRVELEEKEEEVSLINSEEMENEEKIALLENEIKELKKGDKRKLKKKVEELEERLDEAWSEYNTEVLNTRQAEKELEELQNENEELKKENKGLRNGGGDYISRKEHQKVCDILNDEAEDYKEKFMTITGQLK